MISFRKFKKEDAVNVSRFIKSVSLRYNKNEHTKEGRLFFESLYTPSNIKNWEKDYTLLVLENGKIIGIGRAKQNGWITHVYIRGNKMGKGIGSLLMNKMEVWIKKNKHKIVFLNSSIFALNFYKKLGYRRVSKIKIYHGIKMCPMRKFL